MAADQLALDLPAQALATPDQLATAPRPGVAPTWPARQCPVCHADAYAACYAHCEAAQIAGAVNRPRREP